MTAKQPAAAFIFAVDFHDLGAHLGQRAMGTILTGPSPALLSDAHAIIRNALAGGAEGMVDGEDLRTSGTMARRLVAVYCYPRGLRSTTLASRGKSCARGDLRDRPQGHRLKRTGDVSDPPLS